MAEDFDRPQKPDSISPDALRRPLLAEWNKLSDLEKATKLAERAIKNPDMDPSYIFAPGYRQHALLGSQFLAVVARAEKAEGEALERAATWCAQKRDETARDFNAAKNNSEAQPLFAASIAYDLACRAIVSMKSQDTSRAESPSTAEAVDAERAWRCFHCDEVFTDKGTASAHFGDESLCGPACKIAGSELGLVGYIRKLERQISDYQAENDPLSIAWYAQRADHARALVMTEQSGYDKGLADGRSAPNATLIRETVEAEREACELAVGQAAWRHEGDDAYSQGLDKGARDQVAACIAAIRARKEG